MLVDLDCYRGRRQRGKLLFPWNLPKNPDFLDMCVPSLAPPLRLLLLPPPSSPPYPPLRFANVDGWTQLRFAVEGKKLENVDVLLDHDADVEKGDNEGNAFLLTVLRSGLTAVKSILTTGENFNSFTLFL